ncbi:MAG: MFS transporter [Hydrococcus sp. Prado102]|jgi:MFS family permease|nr:MFS transporter [Hydrococcus sp. Prado102]
MSKNRLFQIPQFNFKVWILAAGRLLSQVGTGLTLFYASIFFVDRVGLSATAVGICLGLGSVSGILGRFLGGSFADSQSWGRRKTLLLSAAISTIADLIFAFTYNFSTLAIANLLMGLGVGLYWPATEAAVADLTTLEQRNEAFAITRLADNIGLGLGVVFGGAFIAISENYRVLFIIDGVSFLIFFVIIYFAIIETYEFSDRQSNFRQGWIIALSDRRLLVYAVVNIFFTTYLSQVQSTIPLYFKSFTVEGNFSVAIISAIFAGHVILTILCQLPVARFINRYSYSNALAISFLFWGIGFIAIWLTGIVTSYALTWAILALSILAIATVSYTPVASAFVVDLSPPSMRGIYLSINSQCWAIGYLIGPPLGGLALDSSPQFARNFWVFLALSIILGISILQYLNRLLQKDNQKEF